jgi:uncharacterized protein (TIGR02118 family)
MIKIIALYRRPDDYQAFLRHYHDVHLPLVRKIPGLIRLEVAEVKRTLISEFPYVLMTEMCYPDGPTFKAAMKSPEQAAVAADLQNFAADLVTAIQVETMD